MADYPVTPHTPALSEQEIIRRQKLQSLIDAGQNPYAVTHFDVTHHSKEITDNFESLEGKTVSLAGRMVSRRVMGKASFAHLLDAQGEMQIYVTRDDLGEDAYAAFKKDDLGDIIGVSGTVFCTKTGEASIHVKSLTLLCKSLKVLPEKFHGLVDTDLRYRQRYVDCIVNPEVRDTFRKRSRIIAAVREFLDGRGYLEVDTPVLHTVEIGASARPFRTFHNTDEPLGFLIEDGRTKERLLWAVDTANLGVTADKLTYIAVECNYEERLLNRSDRIPSVLKDRIRHSHFEVSDVIRWLHKQDLSGVLTIWLLHLSAGNSRAEAWQRRFEREFPGITIRICPE